MQNWRDSYTAEMMNFWGSHTNISSGKEGKIPYARFQLYYFNYTLLTQPTFIFIDFLQIAKSTLSKH